MNPYQKLLLEKQDVEYKKFSERLINDDTYEVIGVRNPELRLIAKQCFSDSYTSEFMRALPHKYQEENMLHTYFIEQIKDYDKAIEELDIFLPYANNWAVTDSFCNKYLFNKANKEKFYFKLLNYINSKHEYTVRYGIVSLFKYIKDDDKIENILKKVIEVTIDTYYVNMAKAWFLCDCIIKQYEKTIVFFEQNYKNLESKFSAWIQNKAIQKCVDSFRVSDEKKAYLKTLRIKNK